MSSNTNPGAGQSPPQPPYPPSTQPLGGIPTDIDFGLSIALIPLFLLAASWHFFTFFCRVPPADPDKPPRSFVFSAIIGVFCVIRTAALSLRAAWSRAPTNARVALAATVFTAAGVLILFVINLFLMGRVVRALQPGFGWDKRALWGFRALLATLIATLVMVVTCSVHSVFILDAATRRIERDVLLFAGVYMTLLALVPAVGVVLARFVPNRSEYPAENFGRWSMRRKLLLLGFMSVLLAFGAGFRAAVNIEGKPVGSVEWYLSTPVYYCVNFAIELIVVISYAIFRFDLMFEIPKGSSGPGDYSKGDREPEVEEEAHELDDGMGDSAGSAMSEAPGEPVVKDQVDEGVEDYRGVAV